MSFTLVKNELILTITKDKLVCILSIQKVKFDAKVQLFSDIRKFLSNFFTFVAHFYGNPICQRSNRLSRGGIGAETFFKRYKKILKDMRNRTYARCHSNNSIYPI